MVRWEKGISLAEYKAFEVLPVSNETGKTFKFDVADVITQHIKSKLKDKGYVIIEENNTEGNIIVIKSRLLSYEPGNAFVRWLGGPGTTKAMVKTSLIDKRTGKVVGLMMNNERVAEGGLFTAGAGKRVLKAIARGITKEIDDKLKGE